MPIILQILENVIFLSLLGPFVFLVEQGRHSMTAGVRHGLMGIAFGIIAFLVTVTPVELSDGATVDARAGPVILASIMAGPIGGLIAASSGSLGRVMIGGSFTLSGSTVYFVYAAIGIIINHLHMVPASRVATARSICLMTIASIAGASAMFFLIRPANRALAWLQEDLPFILTANVLSVTVAAVAAGIAIKFLSKAAEVDDLNETLKLAKRAGRFGIWDLDLRTGVLQWDERSLEMHDLPRAEFSGNLDDWKKTVHPDDLGPSLESLTQSLKKNEVYETEYRVVCKGGDIRFLRGNGVILRKKDRIPYRVIGTNLDLTDLRLIEANLLSAQAQTLQSQKFDTIGQLTGGVAHDFNNLLAIIMGNQELLKEHSRKGWQSNSDADELIEATLEASRRGAELTQNMLAYARKAQLAPTETDLNAVVQETVKWLRRTIETRIEIEKILEPEIWSAFVDRVSLQNALVNLLVNARDAIKGVGKITIRTKNVIIERPDIDERRQTINSGRYVMLWVADTGSGIASGEIDRIFDPFHTTKPVGKGSGLGLSMVEGFLNQSNGAIRVYSDLGVGTSFKLYFPVLKSGLGTVVPTAVKAIREVDRAARFGRILLVEDQPEVLLMLQKTLEGARYDVVTAISGDEAFHLFRTARNFDLVATDMVMPSERQGPQLAADIRSLDPDIPFIFLSGYASEGISHGNWLSYKDRRIMKPVSREVLLDAVDSAILDRS